MSSNRLRGTGYPKAVAGKEPDATNAGTTMLPARLPAALSAAKAPPAWVSEVYVALAPVEPDTVTCAKLADANRASPPRMRNTFSWRKLPAWALISLRARCASPFRMRRF